MHSNEILKLFIIAIFITACSSSNSPSSPVEKIKNVYPQNIDSGRFVDTRDGQSYKTVKIGNQNWMAENLNYDTLNKHGSWCYNDSNIYCHIYGRYYTWSAAMALDSIYNSTRWTPDFPHQGVCPNGWHVPTDSEWHILIQFTDSLNSGKILKGNDDLWRDNTGTDYYGFNLLPAGGGDHFAFPKIRFVGTGDFVSILTASQYTEPDGISTGEHTRDFYYNYNSSLGSPGYGSDFNTLRCLEN